jgi:long-chain acyl-CoA synthetase
MLIWLCGGDSQKYIGALIVPNFEEFMALFEKNGVSYDQNAIKYIDVSGVKTVSSVGDDFINQAIAEETV